MVQFQLFSFVAVILTVPQHCFSYNYLSHGGSATVHSGGSSISHGTFDAASQQIQDWTAHNSLFSSGTVRDDNGCPVPSLTASIGIGQHDHLLLQDLFLINKLATFNRERIPERVAHAKGHGAFGHFRLTKDLSTLTKADFLNGVGKITPILVRFSTVAGRQGSLDLRRDGRGFAVKFYTNDGIHDIVGLAVAHFPIRDPILFGDLNRSHKPNPVTNLNDNNMRWDFSSLRPETIMHTLKSFSDFGSNSRVLNGFSVHAFKFVNREGIAAFAKFHFISQQPFTWFNGTEIEILNGRDPDYIARDLYNAIANKRYPKWTVSIQVMTVEQALKYPVNPFDATKEWRIEEFPLLPIGEFLLSRNPQDFFNDIEQAAFAPSRMVPGIEPSPDRLLIGRMFSYPDAQRYRLGVNFARLEVNKPKFPVNNYDRDGFMRDNPNGGGGPNYFPNSFHGPTVNGSVMENIFHVRGLVDRIDTVNDVEDNFRLARLYLYKDLSKAQRERVAVNLGGSLANAIQEVRERALKNLFFRITPEFGQLVWQEVELALSRVDG